MWVERETSRPKLKAQYLKWITQQLWVGQKRKGQPLVKQKSNNTTTIQPSKSVKWLLKICTKFTEDIFSIRKHENEVYAKSHKGTVCLCQSPQQGLLWASYWSVNEPGKPCCWVVSTYCSGQAMRRVLPTGQKFCTFINLPQQTQRHRAHCVGAAGNEPHVVQQSITLGGVLL